jgi:hypothetical protein
MYVLLLQFLLPLAHINTMGMDEAASSSDQFIGQNFYRL